MRNPETAARTVRLRGARDRDRPTRGSGNRPARSRPSHVERLATVVAGLVGLFAVLGALPTCRSAPAATVPAPISTPSEEVRPEGGDVGRAPESASADEAPGPDDDDTTIRGRVLDAEGRPLAGAAILVFADHGPLDDLHDSGGVISDGFFIDVTDVTAGPDWSEQVASATSGGDGRFRVTGLPQGACTVRATLPGFRPAEAAADPDRGPTVELRLAPFAGIAGRLVDSEGRPIPHGTVRLYANPRFPSLPLSLYDLSRPPVSRAETDPEGRFRLTVGVEGAANVLVAEAPGHAPAVIDGVVEPAEGAPERVVRLPAGLPLAGRVTGADGVPLEGARVRLLGAGIVLPGPARALRLPDPEVSTDRRGEFAFDGLEDRDYRVLVGHTERSWARVEGRPTRGMRYLLQVVLERGETLAGRVIDALSSAPIGGARVSVREGSFPERTAVADPDGRYQIPGLDRSARSLVLRAEAEGHLPQRREVRPPRDAGDGALDDADFALEPLASVRGVAIDRAGSPVPRAKVRCRHPAARLARTGARGEFLLSGVRPAVPNVLEIEHPSFVTERIGPLAPRPGETVDVGTIVLSRGGRVRGRVETPGGRPLEGVLVRAFPQGQASILGRVAAASAATDAAGEFLIATIPAGAHDLEASSGSAIEPAVRPVEVRGEETVDGIVLHLIPGRDLRGRVVSDRGDPVPEAAVRVLDFGRGFRLHETRTDSRGRFEVRGIAATDRVELRAEHPAHGTFASREVPLGAGDVTIRLSTAAE